MENKKLQYKKRIYYSHTDAGGIVYHTNYISFCEEARSEIFFSKNIFFEKDEGYVVKDIVAKFISSAKLGDIIEIETKISEIGKVKVEAIQSIYKNDKKIFEMKVTLAYLKNGKPSKIPENHLKLLYEYKE
ncbi:acyl-CoA thioester hydrolase [Lebetimonas natsushimae]|uniref:Acyl-CoA thioester hydrolase n=1 Tax=Lebetimonas natsushimae TaxID=1936991 RepID=A0A292Y856_9BACT|nr:thioesterase family protein [Lebetimonas natsushimae]GAX86972.1 acyl-CoA thioester hydrolase [Lebetimonas natsushimae]